MVKLLTAIKFHDIIGMLDTHIYQKEVDSMVKNNRQTFQEFYELILKKMDSSSTTLKKR